MMWPFKSKPKKCPTCGMPYKSFAKIHEWYTGGWISGEDKKVPLVGHSNYANDQILHYEFEWRDLYVEYGEAGFDINLELMPEFIQVCGCSQ